MDDTRILMQNNALEFQSSRPITENGPGTRCNIADHTAACRAKYILLYVSGPAADSIENIQDYKNR